jgi:hypothetical protein
LIKEAASFLETASERSRSRRLKLCFGFSRTSSKRRYVSLDEP